MLLCVPFKAATENEVKTVLEQALSLTRPYGIPTIILQGEKLAVLEGVSPANNADFFYNQQPFPDYILTTCGVFEEVRTGDLRGLPSALCQDFHFANVTMKMQENSFDGMRLGLPRLEEQAHFYSPSEYQEPGFNLIITAPPSVTRQDIGSFRIGEERHALPDVPGFDAQYQCHALLHEIGHGTGAGEAQTDMMAAIVCRQAFEDTTFLSVIADRRALSPLFTRSSLDNETDDYGWQIVDGLDKVIAKKQSEIDAMSEDDVKALRFTQTPQADAQRQSICKIFYALNSEQDFIDSLQEKDLAAFARILGHHIDQGIFQPAEEAIAARMTLAAHRLSTAGAYEAYRVPTTTRRLQYAA